MDWARGTAPSPGQSTPIDVAEQRTINKSFASFFKKKRFFLFFFEKKNQKTFVH
jgi:hypothetical protein